MTQPADTTPVEALEAEPLDPADQAQADPEQPATEAPADEPTRAARRQHRDTEKYRQQLRDEQAARAAEQAQWESERTGLRSTVERYQRAEVERAVANRLADPADLWAAGVHLGDVLADDGTIDSKALDSAVMAVLAEHPHWRTPFNAAAPASQVSFGATRPDVGSTVDPFVLAFTPPDQR